MNAFVQQLINAVTGKEALQFSAVLTIVLLYLVLLWIAFCLWVLIDSYRRYKNILIAIGITVIVFILNFPALILYLILRPEEESYAPSTNAAQGGVEVPVIKFVDENGNIKLALNLQVSSNWTPNADMTIAVGFDSAREDIKVSNPRVEVSDADMPVAEPASSSSFREKLSAFTQRARAPRVEEAIEGEERPQRKFTDMKDGKKNKRK